MIVEFVVTDINTGRPVRAHISIVRGGREVASTICNGVCRVDLLPGTYLVVASATGYVTARLTIRVPPTKYVIKMIPETALLHILMKVMGFEQTQTKCDC